MQNIKIDDLELEEFLEQEYNGNNESAVRAFVGYLKTERIKRDVQISIEELERGKGIDIDDVFDEVAAKYENK